MPTTSPAAAPSPVSTAGTVPVGSALPKVLRIGIIVEGKIVQERLVRAGTSVTLGGPSSTFDVSGSGLPDGFELFAYSKPDKAYALQAPVEVDGRMHWKGAIASPAISNGQPPWSISSLVRTPSSGPSQRSMRAATRSRSSCATSCRPGTR